MKNAILAVSVAVIMIICLCALSSNPIILGKENVSENTLEAIKSQSSGIYSNKLPLVPMFVTVDNTSDTQVFYTIHYFPLGTVGMSYTEEDGYNMEKQLTRLQ